MRFNKYFFENFPPDTPFDIKNPRYVLSLDGVDPILEKIIISTPYSLTTEDFSNAALVRSLLYVGVLQQKNGKIGLGVPFFVEKDAEVLMKLSKRVANSIANELIGHKEQIFSIANCIHNGYCVERNLYHILCGYIFDGLIFDYLEENELVTTACVHDSGLDYLVILYEDTPSLNEYSDLLLCSYNRLTINGKGFVSFGDSNGNRKDLYRYKRLNERNLLSEKEKAYICQPTESLIENFKKVADGYQVDSSYMATYEYFGYCQNGKIVVPIYNSHSYDVANRLYEFVLGIVKKPITNALFTIQEKSSLLAIAHDVKVKDIANEIYHLIFGEVNECLVKSRLVSEPHYIQGEGRYFKSFEM